MSPLGDLWRVGQIYGKGVRPIPHATWRGRPREFRAAPFAKPITPEQLRRIVPPPPEGDD